MMEQQVIVDLVKTKAGDLVKVVQNPQVATSAVWGYWDSPKAIGPQKPIAADKAGPRDVRRYRTERAAHRARWRRLLAELDRELSRD
jgi:hypothetical protein